MANSSINLTSLDFETLKGQLKTYLKAQKQFVDYDFEGSNMSVLLDILTYNTYTQSFYLNMIGNEMFLDTAQLRDSVVSHAKDLNYVPRSYRSASARVDITITPSPGEACTAVVIPKGASFTTRLGSNNFTFTTDQNISVISSNNYFKASNVQIFEGSYIFDRYVMNYANTVQKFIISNETVDTNSLTLSVVEDTSTVLSYKKVENLFDLDYTSKVFFLQAAPGNKYEIVFGDGVSGRKPKDGAIIIAEYRLSSGEFPNGANTFKSDGEINGYSNVVITTVEKASGGSPAETLNSIRFNAPRKFTTQERAVTEEDYETLLKANFPEINVVSAYGGDQADPPQYGKVFVAVDLTNADALPESKRIIYRDFIKKRSPLSIDPIFIEPQYMYVKINSTVRYNINLTPLTPSDIRTLVISSIANFNDTYLNNFKKVLRYSQLTTAIDFAHPSIVGNDTDILAILKINPTLNTIQNFDINFNMPLYGGISELTQPHAASEDHVISSSSFVYENQTSYLEDDGVGNINIVTSTGATHTFLKQTGTVNYDTGAVQITNFKASEISGNSIKIYARPRTKDIFSQKNVILSIIPEDITLTVPAIRE